eukprot:4147284-Prymnesium_polylepis.1
MDRRTVNPVARVLLAGARDPSSVLGKLPPELVQHIYHRVRQSWRTAILVGCSREVSWDAREDTLGQPYDQLAGVVVSAGLAFAHIANVQYDGGPTLQGRTNTVPLSFPTPDKARPFVVNMMPFDIDEQRTLPVELHGYWPLIDRCREAMADESGAQILPRRCDRREF